MTLDEFYDTMKEVAAASCEAIFYWDSDMDPKAPKYSWLWTHEYTLSSGAGTMFASTKFECFYFQDAAGVRKLRTVAEVKAVL